MTGRSGAGFSIYEDNDALGNTRGTCSSVESGGSGVDCQPQPPAKEARGVPKLKFGGSRAANGGMFPTLGGKGKGNAGKAGGNKENGPGSAADEVYTAFSSYRTNPEGVIFSRCRHNRYGDVERALKQGGEGVAAARDAHGNTLLHVAAQNGLKRIAKLLLRHGAALDAQNNKGATPLHYCFTYGYGGLGQYLIGKGADQGARDCEGRTCFDVQRAQPNQASVPLTAR